MVAIIGGEPRRFRPLVDLYRETGKRFGYSPDRLRVGVHALGDVAPTTQEAIDDFFPGYVRAVTSVAKERGWPVVTRTDFDAQRTPEGGLLVGNAEEVVEKIVWYGEALGGISRLSFQMNVASLPHAKLMRAIEAIGARVVPALREHRSSRGTRICSRDDSSIPFYSSRERADARRLSRITAG
jgi:alkanesulfonate monooxygenase SsuD/methylene tetrahydromethanopterin reductase-like flavin-dependent oxidoreductase (luciferase family)